MGLRAVVSHHHSSVPVRGSKITEEEFKKWLIKHVDSDGNKQITKQELRQALRSVGLKWAWLKVWQAMGHADLNGNNCIELDREMDELVQYAANRWGIVIVKE